MTQFTHLPTHLPSGYTWKDKAILRTSTTTDESGTLLSRRPTAAITWCEAVSADRIHSILDPDSVGYLDDEAAEQAEFLQTYGWSGNTKGYTPAMLDLIQRHSLGASGKNKAQMDKLKKTLQEGLADRLTESRLDLPASSALTSRSRSPPSAVTTASAKQQIQADTVLQKLEWDCSADGLFHLLDSDQDFKDWWIRSKLPDISQVSVEYRAAAHDSIDQEEKRRLAVLDMIDRQAGDVRPALVALTMVVAGDDRVVVGRFTGSKYDLSKQGE